MKKRILGLAAMVGMTLLFAACGKEEASEKSTKDYVYKTETIDVTQSLDPNTISNFYIQNDRMYFHCYEWDEEGNAKIFIINTAMDGSDSKRTDFPVEESLSYSNIFMDKEGNYYCIGNQYEEETGESGEYYRKDSYYLMKMDAAGKEAWRKPLGEGKEDYWIQWMIGLQDGQILLADTTGMFLYDAEGNPVKEVVPDKELEGGRAFQLQDGKLVINTFSSESGKDVFYELDVKTGKVSEEYTIPGNSSGYSYYPGVGYDLFLVGGRGIYGYNLGDTEMKQLMDYIDSDLTSSFIYSVAAVSERELYGLMNDDVTGEATLVKFTKVDPKDVVDKTVLTLACNGLNWEVRRHVIDFNKNNGTYRIKIMDYSEYNTDEDYSAGITKLNTDIASGKVPDILLLDNRLPVNSYVSKGLFEDLYPFMEADEEIKKEDFFPNILAALEVNGKLYRMVPNYTICTAAGKTSLVGTEQGWTIEDLNRVMESMPEGAVPFTEMTKSMAINNSIQFAGDQFINWETGECNFKSEGFISLLEFAKQFPDELGDDFFTDAYWQQYDSMWRNDKVLLNILYFDSFSTYNFQKKGTFGEDITMIGFPSENKKGSAIMPNLELVMSAKSQNKDGVWEFMRYFITDEYQNKVEYGWPLSMKPLDALAEKEMKNPTYEDENGNLVEYERTYTVGGIEVPIKPMTEAEKEEVLAFIKSVDQLYNYNEELQNIIAEEAAPYFAGQKKAEEVADIIQSRVQIYVNENR